jgi:hypothetical protein
MKTGVNFTLERVFSSAHCGTSQVLASLSYHAFRAHLHDDLMERDINLGDDYYIPRLLDY